jgi:cytoskeletal protein CcmA (bactofilin family)
MSSASKERTMFGKPKDDHDQPAAAVQRPQPAPATKPAVQAPDDPASTIGRKMSVVGKIVDEGTVRVLGRIEGELRASIVLIEEGAKVEGDLVAEELTIGGTVKGTIHANRVRLNSTAVVEGDIFHRSLSIEENARFEGMSKREDRAPEEARPLLQHSATHNGAEADETAIHGNPKANGVSRPDEPLGLEAS